MSSRSPSLHLDRAYARTGNRSKVQGDETNPFQLAFVNVRCTGTRHGRITRVLGPGSRAVCETSVVFKPSERRDAQRQEAGVGFSTAMSL